MQCPAFQSWLLLLDTRLPTCESYKWPVSAHTCRADKPPNSVAVVENGWGPTAISQGLEVAAVSRARHEYRSEDVVTIGSRPPGDKSERWLPQLPRRLLFSSKLGSISRWHD